MLKMRYLMLLLSLGLLAGCQKTPEAEVKKEAEAKQSEPKLAQKAAEGKALANIDKAPAEIAEKAAPDTAPAFVHPVSPKQPPVAQSIKGTIVETLDGGGYTYVRINDGTDDIWLAGPGTRVRVGDFLEAPRGALMRNFKSKTLDRIFPEIYFVESIKITRGEEK